jgi:hypothetical protein
MSSPIGIRIRKSRPPRRRKGEGLPPPPGLLLRRQALAAVGTVGAVGGRTWRPRRRKPIVVSPLTTFMPHWSVLNMSKAIRGRTEKPRQPLRRLDNDLVRLHDLINDGDLTGARQLVHELAQRWPGSERVRRLATILAPPIVSIRPGNKGRPRHEEHAWLREHAHEYPACWLAILGSRLVAAHPDARVVLAAVRQDPTATGALLHFQPGSQD